VADVPLPAAVARRAGLGEALTIVAVVSLSLAYLVIGLLPDVPEVARGFSDVSQHGGAYALLGLLSAAAGGVLALRRPALAGWAYAAGHGALLELLQHFCPPRRAEWGDLAVDAVAAAVGAGLWAIVRRRR